MSDKEFRIDPEELEDKVKGMGYSIVSNMILKDGMKVGFMYREEPFDEEDSGWRFLSGMETEDYLDNDENSKAIGVNAVANYDPAIIPYLNSKRGISLERVEGSERFNELDD